MAGNRFPVRETRTIYFLNLALERTTGLETPDCLLIREAAAAWLQVLRTCESVGETEVPPSFMGEEE